MLLLAVLPVSFFSVFAAVAVAVVSVAVVSVACAVASHEAAKKLTSPWCLPVRQVGVELSDEEISAIFQLLDIRWEIRTVRLVAEKRGEYLNLDLLTL